MIDSLIDKVKSLSNIGAGELSFVIEKFSPDWELWEHIPRLTLIETVVLSYGLTPDSRDYFSFDLDTRKDPKGFIHVISIELSRRLRIAEASYRTVDFDGEMSTLPIPDREISTHLFHDWAISKGWELPARFPKAATNLQASIQSLYPWGTHNTKLLMQLSEAAIKFWSLYDPTEPSTAPTNEQVETWLIAEGVPKRTAEVMATILRADGLSTGRRK